VIFWNVFLLMALAVAAGVAFSVGTTWTERIVLASVLCGLVLYAFYVLSKSGQFSP
jgi:lipoprotein signal peptidase